MTRIRLLIVDEHPLGRTLGRAAFGQRGYDAVTAATPDEAVDAVRTGDPDVVILEWAFRQGGGIGLARRMRGASTRCRLIVIALSVADEPTGFLASEDLDAYFVKPTPAEHIDASIRAHLAANQLRCPGGALAGAAMDR